MTKESFFINVQGEPFGNGILCGGNTHMRGEGVWMLDIALNMARHGHDVTILAYQWGDTTKYLLPKNITLQKEFEGDCDVFMDSGWEDTCAPQRYKDINAKCYIHGWHGDPAATTFLKYQKTNNLKNHYIGGMSRCFKYYCDQYPFSIYAPIPLVDKIKALPNIDSKKMLWANKGALHVAYIKYSEQILEFMERHLDYEYTILFYGDIIDRATNEVKRPEMIKRFENLPNVNLIEPYCGLPHDELMKELDNSILLLDNGQPSAHPQSLEALCMGCIPLIWDVGEHNHHFQTKNYENVPKRYGIEGPNMDKLLDDKSLHIEYYNALKDVTTDHEYDNAYDILMNQIYNRIY